MTYFYQRYDGFGWLETCLTGLFTPGPLSEGQDGDEFEMNEGDQPLEAVAPESFWHQGLQLRPEAGVEPTVQDRVGEGGGEGDGVAQPKHEVERVRILK